ncbi:hypothetical protein ABEB36_013609 [Hypothenemus hampei]|uniref:Uncharacterized protein n=1 Tax=Hypothenemus hampei TaxID=57062 RepID=A0ABD1E4Q1_HYPHA
MGKADQISDNIAGLSPQSEASKLLEQALMQMDGIISGSGSLTAHSPDYTFAIGPTTIKEAASNLATALQNSTSPPPPDPAVAKVLLLWIQQIKFMKTSQMPFELSCAAGNSNYSGKVNSSPVCGTWVVLYLEHLGLSPSRACYPELSVILK